VSNETGFEFILWFVEKRAYLFLSRFRVTAMAANAFAATTPIMIMGKLENLINSYIVGLPVNLFRGISFD
jgi:hypothetical protein